MGIGPFKGNPYNSHSPLSYLAKISTGFRSQRLSGLIFLTLEPLAGKPGVQPGPLTQVCQDYPPDFVSPHAVVRLGLFVFILPAHLRCPVIFVFNQTSGDSA